MRAVMDNPNQTTRQALAYSAYSQAMSAEERDRLIESFLPYIKYQALRMAARLPSSVSVDDLNHAGVLGLLDAIEKFNPAKNTQLKTYAEFRIKGAILDELRAMDWVSRSAREKMKRLNAANSHLEVELQRHPQAEEVAEFLGINMEEYHQLVHEAYSVGVISTEDIVAFEGADPEEIRDSRERSDPQDSFIWKEMRKITKEALNKLNEKEKLVLTLYYYEELTMKEIGEVLGVTESRVSQIRSQSLRKLKKTLAKTV